MTDSLNEQEPISQTDIPTWKQITTLKVGTTSSRLVICKEEEIEELTDWCIFLSMTLKKTL